MTESPAIREDTGRNEDGTFKPGVSGNPAGRPRNTLKDYVRQKFMNMTDSEKEEFMKTLPPEIIWRMGEGNPATTTDITSKGEQILGNAIVLADFKADEADSK